MKFLKACPILIGIVIITIALTVVSYAFEGTTYAEYTEGFDAARTPHFVLVAKGLTDGVMPWDEAKLYEADTEASAEEGVSEADNEQEETVPEDQESDALAENTDTAEENVEDIETISENSISENDADKTYELTEVDEDYFLDALFIGDSRTEGLSEYCAPLDERATFYAKVSLTIYGVMDKQFVKKGDNKISVSQALSEEQFGKIYIMLGLNEIGTGTAETFAEEYGHVIERIRELQPDAIIFIQGIMHVTERKSSGDKYFNNQNIDERNAAIAQFANDRDIFYIDMNEAVDDENGNLLQELTFDDVHLKASSYQRWYDYLLTHGVVRD